MSGKILTAVAGRGMVVRGDDVDTDRIIPARFMRCVTFDGLGEYAFHDERFSPDGTAKGHPFDDPNRKGAPVMIAGRNFGCGSSREHAPQALSRAGVRGIIARSFAEIFFGNCTTLGIVCARVSDGDALLLEDAVLADALGEVRMDVAGLKVSVNGVSVPFVMPASAREALLSGRWDPLDSLCGRVQDVVRLVDSLPYAAWTSWG